jgi:hypothetical protein
MSSAFTETEMVSLDWRSVDQVATMFVAHARFDNVVVVDATVVVVAEVTVAHMLATSITSTATPLVARHIRIRPGYGGHRQCSRRYAEVAK